MQIKLKVSISGTRDGVDWPPAGGVLHLPDDEAAGMVAAGLASPVDEPVVEKAIERRPVEKRAHPRKG